MGSQIDLIVPASSGGGGTVTSVAVSVPAFMSVAGSPVTTSGILALTYSGTPLPVANGGTGITSFGTGVATAMGNNVNAAGGLLTTAYTGFPTSVANSDGTLTISPTTGSVVASLALGHANTWTGVQTLNAPVIRDSNGLNVITTMAVASSVNNLAVSNAATGTATSTGVKLASIGSDTDIPMTLATKGAGNLYLAPASGTVVIPVVSNLAYLYFKDTGGTAARIYTDGSNSLFLTGGNAPVIISANNFKPNSDNACNNGFPGKSWAAVYTYQTYIASGTNCSAGTVTLSSGAATITSTAIDVHSVIMLSLKTSSGTPGIYAPLATVAAGSATISGLATDNSTYNWVAFEVN